MHTEIAMTIIDLPRVTSLPLQCVCVFNTARTNSSSKVLIVTALIGKNVVGEHDFVLARTTT